MMDSSGSGSGHGAMAARAAPHQVAAFKARLAAASRPDPAPPKGRWAALRPGALAARPAAAARLSTIESAGSDGLNATAVAETMRRLNLEGVSRAAALAAA